MMAVAKKLLQTIYTTGQLPEVRVKRTSAAAAKPPTAPQTTAPLAEKRTERRLAAKVAERALLKPK